MPTRNTTAITARLSDGLVAKLDAFALDAGLVTPEGAPSRTAAIRALLEQGLDQDQMAALIRASRQHSYGQALRVVHDRMIDMLHAIAAETADD
jgi:hypothetical protein